MPCPRPPPPSCLLTPSSLPLLPAFHPAPLRRLQKGSLAGWRMERASPIPFAAKPHTPFVSAAPHPRLALANSYTRVLLPILHACRTHPVLAPRSPLFHALRSHPQAIQGNSAVPALTGVEIAPALQPRESPGATRVAARNAQLGKLA